MEKGEQKVDSENIKNHRDLLPSFEKVKVSTENVNIYYGEKQAVKNISVDIPEKKVTAFIGPSGCGKSTLLLSINRMNDTVKSCRVEGKIKIEGQDIYDKSIDPVLLRARVGMVFQKPNPFPKSIYQNVAYGPKIHGLAQNKAEFDEVVVRSLERAGLFEEVKDRLHESAIGLSGGQQQRLCIARAIALEPEILLMDEPCSSLDPLGTSKIEELMFELKDNLTIVIVTHNMQQAARVSDYTAFLYLGELVEFGKTDSIFINPKNKLTEHYITGRFG